MRNNISFKPGQAGLAAFCIGILSGCGGGSDAGGDNSSAGSNRAAPSAAQPPAAQPPAPRLAAAIVLEDGTSVGTPAFAKGATAAGGGGQAVQGLPCEKPVKSGPAYGYAHLNLVVDGQPLAIPDGIGLVASGSAGITDPAVREVGCFYPLMTTDASGKIRIRPGSATPYTLGQFFALWGQPLGTANVAGHAGKPVKVFVKDGGTLTEYTGAPDALPLAENREITLQVGSALSEVPNYEWKNPPPLSTTPVAVNRGASGAALVGQAGLEDNRSNGRGGQGQPVAGLSCYGPLNQTTFKEIYHVHSHLAIYQDGVRLAIPPLIGIVGNDQAYSTTCVYPLHSHDLTGAIHVEPASDDPPPTLGQFFGIWGQPLSRTDVAGRLRTPVVVYVRDGGNLRIHQGDPADIELTSHRSIVIQMGTPLGEIPVFELADESR